MDKNSRIFVAGGRGLVGSAIVRRCRELGYDNLLLPGHSELDLCNQQAVNEYFARNRPEYVILAAARVGGIQANNTMPADFIRDNLLITTNVIDAAWRGGTRKLLFLGSSCIYPRLAPQPLREESLLTGALEPTNEWYIFLMLRYSSEAPINVGCGEDLSIHELALKIARVTGFDGRLAFDTSRPDGTPRKVLDVSRLTTLGWKARISLDEGLASTWEWYQRATAAPQKPLSSNSQRTAMRA